MIHLLFLFLAVLMQSTWASTNLCDSSTANQIVNITLLPPNVRSQILAGETVRVKYAFYRLPSVKMVHIAASSSDEDALKVIDTNDVLRKRFRNITEFGVKEMNKTEWWSPSNATISLPPQVVVDDCVYDLFVNYITVEGDFLGKSNLTILIDSELSRNRSSNMSLDQNTASIQIVVLRKNRVVEIVFRVLIVLFIVIITFSMGAALDPKVILSYLKRPIAPAVGFGCQYLLMPLIAFAIAMAVPMNKAFGFGLVTTGCSPGGGGSNVWTVLFRGDLNLSMVMTFLSSLAALGMMPLWIFLLKGFFLESNVRIPFEDIARDLLLVLIPVLCGMFVRWKFSKAAAIVCRFTRPMALIFIVYILTFGTYVNWYIFRMFYRMPHILVIGASLPWIGFLAGGLAAFLLRQKRPQIVAISLETGIQNVGIPIVTLMYSLPQPEGSIGAAMPIAVALFTPLPLYILFAVVKIYEKCKSPSSKHSNIPVSSEDEPPEISGSGGDEEEDNDGDAYDEEKRSLAHSNKSSHHENISLNEMD